MLVFESFPILSLVACTFKFLINPSKGGIPQLTSENEELGSRKDDNGPAEQMYFLDKTSHSDNVLKGGRIPKHTKDAEIQYGHSDEENSDFNDKSRRGTKSDGLHKVQHDKKHGVNNTIREDRKNNTTLANAKKYSKRQNDSKHKDTYSQQLRKEQGPHSKITNSELTSNLAATNFSPLLSQTRTRRTNGRRTKQHENTLKGLAKGAETSQFKSNDSSIAHSNLNNKNALLQNKRLKRKRKKMIKKVEGTSVPNYLRKIINILQANHTNRVQINCANCIFHVDTQGMHIFLAN